MTRAPKDARAVALALLQAVLQHSRPLDEALAESGGFAALAPRDRAFARLLVATVLRRLGELDALLAGCLDRPLPPKPRELRDLLRLGAAQAVFLATPPHAAVSASVALAKGPRLAGFRGLVNAVLRRLVREGAERAAGLDAARLDTPDWLWQRLASAYGEAEARAIAAQQLSDPPLDLSVKGDPAPWAERLGARVLPNGSLRLAPGSGEVTRLPGFAEGAWWVQDAAAALPPSLLAPVAGRRVIDLCAAPGGKTAWLAAAGAEVMAVDQSGLRLARVAANLKRLRLAAALVEADATLWRPPAPAPAVLLDAPCSATGTLRRHPDVAHLKRPEDLAGLTALQDRLLTAAAGMVAPGGLLVYATCSLLPEEGEERVRAFLSGGAPFARVPVTAAEIGAPSQAVTAAGDLRTLPSHWPELGGLDGFYACRLRRL